MQLYKKVSKLLYKVLLFFFILTTSLFSKNFTVSYDPDYAPFSYSLNEKPYGLFVDIWKLWAKKNHYNVKFIKAKSWDDAINMAKENKVDFFLGTTPYAKWMKSSDTYYKTKTSIFFLKSSHKSTNKIGIIGNDYKTSLKSKLPNATIISYDEYKQLFKSLLDSKIDAIYDDSLAISYYAIKNNYKHFVEQSYNISESSDIKAISASKHKILIFNQGLKNIKLKELEQIESAWIVDRSMRYFNHKTNLNNKIIYYTYDPDWKPFEYKDEMSHIHMGIIADILGLISKKSGIIFKPIETKTWQESVKLVKEKKVQMLSAVPWTEKRDKYLNFTKNSIYSYPAVLVTYKKFNPNESFENKTIAIVEGNSLGEWIKKRFPKANFIFVKNVKDGFKELKNNDVDFFGINGVTASYYINVLGFSEAKIYTILDYRFHLKIALLKDLDPMILTQIDNALSKITKKELNDIYYKWTVLKVKKEMNWKLLFGIVGIFVFIVLFFIFVNKKLNKLVTEKTSQLKELNENLELKVKQRTTELESINKKMLDNIEYASLIQNSILPQEVTISSFFKEYSLIWQPRDVVGGDIYFFVNIDENEALLIVIDCTGHGVSGAFVTMLVKAIEEQILATFTKDELTPSNILNYFNSSFKKLLFQEKTKADVGFDAGILLINKAKKQLTFSGANIPLYYIEDKKLHIIKADRHSVGYANSNDNYTYTQHTLTLKKNTTFYITTDGFIDQNGGEKSFPFGKKRFQNLLIKNHNKSLNKQKEIFIETLSTFQNEEETNDDITFICFKVF